MVSAPRIGAIMFLLTLCAIPAHAGSVWTVEWWTLDAGGSLEATGGNWRISGTIGQWDATGANEASGGSWTLTGGFWAGPEAEAEPEPDALFSDRFES